jgi:hypothetical protein
MAPPPTALNASQAIFSRQKVVMLLDLLPEAVPTQQGNWGRAATAVVLAAVVLAATPTPSSRPASSPCPLRLA